MSDASIWFLAFVLALLLSCSGSPERELQYGYRVVSASAKSATVLVARDRISVDDAQRVEDFGRLAKATLDANHERLKKCRAADAAAKCANAVSGIELGAGVMRELETYLEANQ